MIITTQTLFPETKISKGWDITAEKTNLMAIKFLVIVKHNVFEKSTVQL